MQTIRIQFKEVCSIMVAFDCVKYYHGDSEDSHMLRDATGQYLIDEIRKQNPDFATAVLDYRYDHIKHRFTVYQKVPYIAEL